ncbi:EAL domain-containing protein [Salinisphaera sp.]|uniref:EAL domain-containing protein n=1 Tax=Salinisphaera sp. TaxID=1914330 RepID=UPI002D79B77C|nr:EAL domain-containing protein [Salinisphaera sp.]HET7314201.1 EAL domain-containing protein [Salinisphaera sp.]
MRAITSGLGAPEVANFLGYRLSSAFQPLLSLDHRRVVGFEALLRGYSLKNDKPASPLEIFEYAARWNRRIQLDRYCHGLHIHNFSRAAPADRWLFLNLDSETLGKKRYLDHIAQLLAEAKLPAHRLVVEILENELGSDRLLFEAADYFRSLGALVALDDFGAGHSNFDRLWRFRPDIVKLDRSIVGEAERCTGFSHRGLLSNLVSMLHEIGSLVVVEGIETEAQLNVALEADADFVQGFLLAKPGPDCGEGGEAEDQLDAVSSRFALAQNAIDNETRRALAPYIQAFKAVESKFEPGDTLKQNCQALLDMPGVLRCLLFNEQSEPIAEYFSNRPSAAADKRFLPVLDGQRGAWFRRPYMREAKAFPLRIHVSRPYLSSTEGCMCMMLSVANDREPRRVFCCKIHWPEYSTSDRIPPANRG